MQKIRRQDRMRAVLPVRVSAGNQTHPACTLDVCAGGARLSGLRFKGALGSTLTVERGIRRVSFRVVWVGASGTPADGQIGVESLEPLRGLWGVDLDPGGGDSEEMARLGGRPHGHEGHPHGHHAPPRPQVIARHFCPGEVEMRREGASGAPLKAKLREIGRQGCFVVSSAKLPLNSRMQLAVKTLGKLLHVRAVLRTSDADGFWMEFFDLHDEELRTLDKILLKLVRG